MSVAISLEAFATPFTTNTRLLVAAEKCLRRWLLPRVDEHRSSLESLANRLSALDVLAPDTGAETSIRSIRALDNLFLITPRLCWDDRSERLFLNNLAIVGWVIDDGRLDEESLSCCDLFCLALLVRLRICSLVSSYLRNSS